MKLSVLFCGSWAYCHKNAERVSFRQNTRLFLCCYVAISGGQTTGQVSSTFEVYSTQVGVWKKLALRGLNVDVHKSYILM